MHPFLLRHRAGVFDPISYNPAIIQDNPVFHNALQLGFHSQLRVSPAVKMEIDLFAEQQGFSFGIHNTDRSFIFPMVWVDGERTFHLLKQDFHIGGSLGSFRNFRLNEGLVMYGLDVQGIDESLRWKKLRFRYVQFNDLGYAIGLNMNEPIILNLRLDSLTLTDQWKLDLGGSLFGEYFLAGPSLNMAIYRAGIRIYAEAGLNLRDYPARSYLPPHEGLKDKTALVTGIHWTHESPKLSLNARAEFRYYGNEYIHGLKYDAIGFKGADAELQKGRTRLRRAYYPLHYLDRPFAQLGFFSDFQQTWLFNGSVYEGPDIAAASLVVDAHYKLPWELYLDAYVDFNLVMVENADPFFYPFFRCGLGWEPASSNTIALNITNKAMDYQLHYPTHQLMKTPFIGLFATRNLPDWKKKTWR